MRKTLHNFYLLIKSYLFDYTFLYDRNTILEDGKIQVNSRIGYEQLVELMNTSIDKVREASEADRIKVNKTDIQTYMHPNLEPYLRTHLLTPMYLSIYLSIHPFKRLNYLNVPHSPFLQACEADRRIRRCLHTFTMQSLRKEQNVTWSQMIQFCEHLEAEELRTGMISSRLVGMDVLVGKHYGVTKEGFINLPWDFTL